MKTPILGSTYVARSVNAADNRMVNLFPEIIQEGGKEAAFLSRAPGLRLYRTVGNGPIRGMLAFGGDLYTVSGNELYKVSSDLIAAKKPGSWLNTPDNCGIIAATNITGSGNITLEMTDAGKYQFTVGTEKWPETPSPWSTVVAGSPHTFALATLTFANTPPVTPVPSGTCDPNAPALTGSYTLLTPPPVEFGGTEGVAIAGNATKILIACGRTNFGDNYGRKVALYDIAANTWTMVADVPYSISSELYVSQLVSIDEDRFLLVIGDGLLYEYSISTNTWTVKAPFGPTYNRVRFGAAFDGMDHLYVYGGLQASALTYSLLRYSLSANSWELVTTVKDFATWRELAGLAYYNGNLYTFYGYDGSHGYADFSNTGYVYSISTGVWTTTIALPGAPVGAGMVASTAEGVYAITSSDWTGGASINKLTRMPTTGTPEPVVLSNLSVVLGNARLPNICRAGSCSIYVIGSAGAFVRIG